MLFNNLRIGTRLGMAFLTLVILLTTVAGIGISRLSNLNDEIDKMVNDRFPKTVLVNEMIDSINVIARAMRNTLLVQKEEDIEKELNRISEQRKIIADHLEKLENNIHSEKGKEHLKKLKDARAVYVVNQEKFMGLTKAGKREEALDLLLTTVRKEQAAYIQAAGELNEFQSDLMKESGKEALSAYESARTLMFGVSIAAIILAGTLGFWITRTITRPLNAAVDVANKLAEGDLTVQVEVSGKDETGLMLMAMKNM
ncbi:MAG: MCP four helix bundle domain-containing protein, partial [Pseudomonadota bacterium]